MPLQTNHFHSNHPGLELNENNEILIFRTEYVIETNSDTVASDADNNKAAQLGKIKSFIILKKC